MTLGQVLFGVGSYLAERGAHIGNTLYVLLQSQDWSELSTNLLKSDLLDLFWIAMVILYAWLGLAMLYLKAPTAPRP
jgi:hypothetical protein